MKELTEYEKQKEKNKDKLVRNEFLYERSSGKFEFPIIKRQEIDINKIKFLSYVDAKKDDKLNQNKTIHFFTYDWLFEKVYEKADDELEKLKNYYCLLSPDFSIFTNMPVALQIESIFKNRWCGAFWQSKGLKVIPTVSWGDEKSFDFCFDGIEQGSIVAVTTYYRENDKESFMLGYNEMLKRIKPSIIICYDEKFDAMTGNIKEFLPTTYEWIKDLSEEDQMQFYIEKHNKNISGLNPNDFKFFKYEDPLAENNFSICYVCENVCMTDDYGNGICKICGWQQQRDALKIADRVQYPNLVSLNKARQLFKEGKKIEPSFDDFIEGLKMYSEMSFEYNNKQWIVFLQDDHILMTSENKDFTFDSYNDFKNNAKIDEIFLKDIWEKVKNPDYYQF